MAKKEMTAEERTTWVRLYLERLMTWLKLHKELSVKEITARLKEKVVLHEATNVNYDAVIMLAGGWHICIDLKARTCWASNWVWTLFPGDDGKESVAIRKRGNEEFQAGCTCPKCGGSGIYEFNGGRCFACVGKGILTEADAGRNVAYWNYNAR